MTDRNIMRTVIFQILLITLVATAPIIGQVAVAQEQTEEQQEPQVTNVDHEFQFSEVVVDVKSKSLSQFIVVMENPTSETAKFQVDGLEGEQSKTIIDLRPDETVQLNITPSSLSYDPTFAQASIVEPVPVSELDAGTDVTDSSLTITYYLIELNPDPPVPHESFIVFLGGLVVILTTASGYLLNSRNTRVAIPKNRSKRSAFTDRPTYNWSEDDPAVLKLAIFIKDWIKAWGLLIVNFTIIVWGSARFLGFEFHGTYPLDFYFFTINVVIPRLLENSMVYMLYGEIIFAMFTFPAGIYMARTKWIELSDVNPKNGDNFLYWLSPQRFNDMRVITHVRKFDTTGQGRDRPIPYELEKEWLYEINEETRRDSFECENYDLEENIAEVSWSGNLKQLNPSKIRSNQKMIQYVQETALWAIDRYIDLIDKFDILAQKRANYLKSRETAVVEGKSTPEKDGTDEWLEEELDRMNQPDLLEGNPLDKAEKLQEIKPEDEEILDESSTNRGSSDVSSRDMGGDDNAE